MSAAIAIERKRYTRSARDFWCAGVRHGGWFGVAGIVGGGGVVVVVVVEVVEIVAWEGQLNLSGQFIVHFRFGTRTLGHPTRSKLPLP